MKAGLLVGRVALVTGAAGGIGRAVATRLGQEGAAVVMADLDRGAVELGAAELSAAGLQATGVALDVTDEGSIDEVVEIAVRAYGRLDVGVAGAGVLHLAGILETGLDDWRLVLDVNLTGVFLTVRAVGRRLVDQGDGGAIVVVSSLSGRRGSRENAAYAASKFGAVGVVECAAADLAPHGVTVNAVCPGQVATAMMDHLVDARARRTGRTVSSVRAETVARVPLSRMAEPEEVAELVLLLASPLGRYITGQSVVIDGGMQIG